MSLENEIAQLRQQGPIATKDAMAGPIPRSNYVLPGLICIGPAPHNPADGHHPGRATLQDLQTLIDCGIKRFVDMRGKTCQGPTYLDNEELEDVDDDVSYIIFEGNHIGTGGACSETGIDKVNALAQFLRSLVANTLISQQPVYLHGENGLSSEIVAACGILSCAYNLSGLRACAVAAQQHACRDDDQAVLTLIPQSMKPFIKELCIVASSPSPLVQGGMPSPSSFGNRASGGNNNNNNSGSRSNQNSGSRNRNEGEPNSFMMNDNNYNQQMQQQQQQQQQGGRPYGMAAPLTADGSAAALAAAATAATSSNSPMHSFQQGGAGGRGRAGGYDQQQQQQAPNSQFSEFYNNTTASSSSARPNTTNFARRGRASGGGHSSICLVGSENSFAFSEMQHSNAHTNANNNESQARSGRARVQSGVTPNRAPPPNSAYALAAAALENGSDGNDLFHNNQQSSMSSFQPGNNNMNSFQQNNNQQQQQHRDPPNAHMSTQRPGTAVYNNNNNNNNYQQQQQGNQQYNNQQQQQNQQAPAPLLGGFAPPPAAPVLTGGFNPRSPSNSASSASSNSSTPSKFNQQQQNQYQHQQQQQNQFGGGASGSNSHSTSNNNLFGQNQNNNQDSMSMSMLSNASSSNSQQQQQHQQNYQQQNQQQQPNQSFPPPPFDPGNLNDLEAIRGPTPTSHWVIRNRVCQGAYPNTMQPKFVEAIGRERFAFLVSLKEEHPDNNTLEALTAAAGGMRPQVLHFPLKDGMAFGSAAQANDFLDFAQRIVTTLQQQPLARMYVACHAGHGRSGMLVACILALAYGLNGMRAVNLTDKLHDCRVNTHGQSSPQTHEQRTAIISLLRNAK